MRNKLQIGVIHFWAAYTAEDKLLNNEFSSLDFWAAYTAED